MLDIGDQLGSKFILLLSFNILLIFHLISSQHPKNQKNLFKNHLPIQNWQPKWPKWSKWSKWSWVHWLLKICQMSTARTSYKPKNVSDSSKSFFYSSFLLFFLFELKILFRPFFFHLFLLKKENNFFGVIYAKFIGFLILQKVTCILCGHISRV